MDLDDDEVAMIEFDPNNSPMIMAAVDVELDPKALAFNDYRTALIDYVGTHPDWLKKSEKDNIVDFVDFVWTHHSPGEEDVNWPYIQFFVKFMFKARKNWGGNVKMREKLTEDLKSMDARNQLIKMERDAEFVNEQLNFNHNPQELSKGGIVAWEKMLKNVQFKNSNDVSQFNESFKTWRETIAFKQVYKKQTETRMPSTVLTDLELKVLDFFEINSEPEEISWERSCRVCFQVGNEMNFLFPKDDVNLKNVVSLAEQINQCTEIPMIARNDGLPQYICGSCQNLLKIVRQFRELCKKTDEEMRMMKDVMKKEDETAEYVIDYVEDENEYITDFIVQPISEIESDAEIEHVEVESPNLFEAFEGHPQEELCSDLSDTNPSIHKSFETPHDHQIHRCDECGITCCTANILQRHLKSHLQNKPFICSECPKTFRTRIALQIHLRSHTNERPYVCETCGKSFKTISAINNHRRAHTSSREFPCSSCPYRGGSMANLRIHERSHTGYQPYECRECPLKFSTASNLSKHVRNIHEQRKTHACDQCDRSFFSRESARKHMVIHNGIKPYQCEHCSMTYSWYNGLQKHMRSQHVDCRIPSEKYFMDKLPK